MNTDTFDPQAYEISIRRVVEDGEVLFKGTVKELPDVAVYEATYKDAYDGVVCVVNELHKQAIEQRRPFPAPSEEEQEFSGRVTLRLTKTVHRYAAIAAEREGVSLNHFISTVVASHVGAVFGTRPSAAPTSLQGVDAVSEQARMLFTKTARIVHTKKLHFPQETSVLGREENQLPAGHIQVRSHELMNLVKTTQPRALLGDKFEPSNAH